MKRTFFLGSVISQDPCGHYESVSFTEMTIDYDAVSILLPVVCPNCGKTNLLSNFCPNCGERIKAKGVLPNGEV